MRFQFELLFSLVLFGLAAADNPHTIIDFESVWDYRVDGQDPGKNWKELNFTLDNSWHTGQAPIGYGGDTTQLNTDVGQPSIFPRPLTYYFRKLFNLDKSGYYFFDLNMKVDDGAIVYINGVEVARYNVALDVSESNLAWAIEDETDEDDVKALPLATCEQWNLKYPSSNVLAVSVHQVNPESPDIRMDLKLRGYFATGGQKPNPPAKFTATAFNTTTIPNQVKLQWTDQPDASYFRILRQAEGDKAWEAISVALPGEATSFIDNDVEPGTTYHYRMFAWNNFRGLSACTKDRRYPNSLPVLYQEETVTTPGKGVSFTMRPTDPDADVVTMRMVQAPIGTQFTFTRLANGVGALKFLSTNGIDVGKSFNGTVFMTDGLGTTTFLNVVQVTKATNMDDCIIAVRANCPCNLTQTLVQSCINAQGTALCTVTSPTYKQLCQNTPTRNRHLRHSPNNEDKLE